MQRLAALFALAAFGLLILISFNSRGPKMAEEARISFQIATGPSGGTPFTVGQTIAGLISHPPGVGRCDVSTVCGPAGVILSARTSQGPIESLTAVNNGLVDSALVQADMVEAAVAGKGPFRRPGPQRHVRTIAALFPEAMHLVAANKAQVGRVSDLVGKRIYLGPAQSGSALMARDILAAFGVGPNAFRRVESDDPAADMAAGKLDAFFVLAAPAFPAVTAALAGGKAHLLPIDGEAAVRLLADDSQLAEAHIAANLYPVSGEVVTLSTRAVWVVNERASDALVYGLTRALFNPANQAALAASHPAAGAIDVATAAQSLPAPLHSGAARYYREVGKL
ncbi:MAG: TAXI family TRAP transporter solute-binding subunit [Alphaproteobacteria bacterium]|nr:TAXI family TRAP transporter solute-binding subunit [Alphaproteobacteria bacterium]